MKFIDLVGVRGTPLRPQWDRGSDTFKSWLMSELAGNVAADLQKWQKDNPDSLPFNSMFGGKTRILIPFHADPMAAEIVKKAHSLFLPIDFDDGLVQVGKNKIKLGRFFLDKRSPFSEEEKQWWVHNGDPLLNLRAANDSKDYSIIISRNPIDIARMSDHDGWTSCHATHREYFKCAVSDAKGAGAISYVVKNEDLGSIDLEAPEIFRDNKRGVAGVVPLSRLRLRKFVHKKDKWDLAVPEDDVYGQKLTGLETTVRNWAFEQQKDKLEPYKGRSRLQDFMLMGGSYQDNSAATLFNAFFDDDEDSGSGEYGGEEDYEGRAQQMQDEIDLIEEEYRNKLKITSFWAEVYNEGDHEPFVSYSASAHLEVPENLLINRNSLVDMQSKANGYKSKIKEAIRKWASDNDIYADDIEIDGGSVRFDLRDDSFDGNTPDALRSFIEGTLMDIEKNAEKLKSGLYNLFVQLGMAEPNHVMNTAANLDVHNEKFANFQWENWEKDGLLTASLKQKMILGELRPKTAGSQLDYGHWVDNFKKDVTAQIFNWAKIVHSRQPSLFQGHPDHDSSAPFSSQMKLQPEIGIAPWAIHGKQYEAMSLEINFGHLEDDKDSHEASELIEFLDRGFNNFEIQVRKIYEKWTRSWDQAQVRVPAVPNNQPQ